MTDQSRAEALAAAAYARTMLARSQATAEEVQELVEELKTLKVDPEAIALLRGAFLARL